MFKHARVMVAAILVLGTATTAAAQGQGAAKANPNSLKYKNTGAKPSTGRSGSASLETRVLLAKNATMLVEASTGSVETGTGPGQIVKTQIKIGDFTKNFNGLTAGGYWSSTFPAASRHASVQVQANVRGIDPKRTDVVTVSTPAMLRPDIAVDALNHMPQQAPQVPVNFAATVVEKNGDVGARADCVLAIDGTPVETAAGIWVDAAGTVSCSFDRAFAAPGTYNVTVSATNVTPGDWDTANNSKSSTITIVEPKKTIKNGYFEAYQQNYEDSYYQSRARGAYCEYYSYYYYCGSSYERINRQSHSSAYMNGWNVGGSPTNTRIDVELFANGQIQHQASVTPQYTSSYDDGDYYSNCTNYGYDYYDYNTNTWVYAGDRGSVCSYGYRSMPGYGSTNFWYQHLAGDAVYYGSDTQCDYWGCNTWTWNNYAYRYGNGADLGWTNGTNVNLKLSFVDADGGQQTMDRTVTIQGSPAQFEEWTNSWEDYWYGNYFERRRYFRFWGYGQTWWNE